MSIYYPGNTPDPKKRLTIVFQIGFWFFRFGISIIDEDVEDVQTWGLGSLYKKDKK